MNEFLFDYGLFLAKTVTFVVAIAAVIVLVARLTMRGHSLEKDKLEIRNLNLKYTGMRLAMCSQLLTATEYKKIVKEENKREKALEKSASSTRPRVFLLNFEGDLKASAVTNLREEITAVLTIARKEDEVVVRIDSPGGLVHTYGLAASQLARIRKRDIKLTAAIDKVAASGGYMMACVATRIIAAPFAVVGSIGVVAQLPNFNRLLKKNDVDFEQFTAGEYKRTVTMFGENTESGREKFRDEIEQTHRLFKAFVSENRPALDIEAVATGEHWYGVQGLEKKLVDELLTSDDYLVARSGDADVFEITLKARKPLSAKLAAFVTDSAERVVSSWRGNRGSDGLL